MNKLLVDLTNFENIPPCLVCDPKECIVAREVYEYATFLSVEKKDRIKEYHEKTQQQRKIIAEKSAAKRKLREAEEAE